MFEKTLLAAVVSSPKTTMSADTFTVAKSTPHVAITVTMTMIRHLRSNLFSNGVETSDPIG